MGRMPGASVWAAVTAGAMLLNASSPLLADDGSGAWRVQRTTDQMSDAQTVSAVRTYGVAGGGSFQVTASCALGMVNFAFDYFGGKGDRDSKLAWQESESYSGTTFGFSTQLSRNVQRWVSLRIRLDQQPVVARNSSSKFQNEAEIVFYDPAEVQRQADQHKWSEPKARSGGGKPDLGDLTSVLNGAMESLQYQMLPSILPTAAAGTLAQLMTTASLRVEIPLADGRAPVVTLNPTDAALRSFLGGCSNGGNAAMGNAGLPGGSVSVEGSYADGRGATLTLSNGQAVVVENGRTSPSIRYRVSGTTLVLIGPDNKPHTMQIGADGSLSVPGEPDFPTMRRIR